MFISENLDIYVDGAAAFLDLEMTAAILMCRRTFTSDVTVY